MPKSKEKEKRRKESYVLSHSLNAQWPQYSLQGASAASEDRFIYHLVK